MGSRGLLRAWGRCDFQPGVATTRLRLAPRCGKIVPHPLERQEVEPPSFFLFFLTSEKENKFTVGDKYSPVNLRLYHIIYSLKTL